MSTDVISGVIEGMISSPTNTMSHDYQHMRKDIRDWNLSLGGLGIDGAFGLRKSIPAHSRWGMGVVVNSAGDQVLMGNSRYLIRDRNNIFQSGWKWGKMRSYDGVVIDSSSCFEEARKHAVSASGVFTNDSWTLPSIGGSQKGELALTGRVQSLQAEFDSEYGVFPQNSANRWHLLTWDKLSNTVLMTNRSPPNVIRKIYGNGFTIPSVYDEFEELYRLNSEDEARRNSLNERIHYGKPDPPSEPIPEPEPPVIIPPPVIGKPIPIDRDHLFPPIFDPIIGP